jgi:hypothetical protein
MQIKLETNERDGCWLEFILENNEQMFEEMIVTRRKKIFDENNTEAINEMKEILEQYSKKKEESSA